MARILAHIERIRRAGRWLHYSREGWHDPRSALVLEPLRYALELRPEWVALEQVPPVLPIWQAMAEVLRDHGYHVETGWLHAEQFGVPQTRKRAILAARRCLPRCAQLGPSVCVRSRGVLPAPSHRKYRKGVAQHEGDPALLPWVSMADALGWPELVMRSNYGSGGDPKARGERTSAEPAPTVTGRIDRNKLALQSRQSVAGVGRAVRQGDQPAVTISTHPHEWVRFGNQEHSAVRSVDEPAATLRFSERMNACHWIGQARNSGPGAQREPRSLDDPSYTIRANGSGSHPSGVEWIFNRPAPTIVGTRRSSEGMLVGRQLLVGERRDAGGRSGGPGLTSDHLAAVRVTVQEAAVLQSVRPDYPWQGSRTAQYQQVGNMIPPLLAHAVLRNLIDP